MERRPWREKRSATRTRWEAACSSCLQPPPPRPAHCPVGWIHSWVAESLTVSTTDPELKPDRDSPESSIRRPGGSTS
ncbi:hypothetical protein JG687_00000775 [Phytophthora cactorum]|uniref:Uncharacterized protein n=1 Tax=Phytophthora cactorum TaxID=29920 RepID=A0A8T1UZ78_9STRA|nr:hypothetical protein JG687_00000775 [Phytophthora cactorum]